MHNLEDVRRAPRKRSRVSPLASKAVAFIKQRQAQLLQAALDTQDGQKAEILRAMAQGLDEAAVLVLAAFDALGRQPSL